VEDLAERLAQILRGREALALARAQEQRLAVGRERDARAELAPIAAQRIAPDDLGIVEPGPVLGAQQSGVARASAPSSLAEGSE
jgi:hypothetical protein